MLADREVALLEEAAHDGADLAGGADDADVDPRVAHVTLVVRPDVSVRSAHVTIALTQPIDDRRRAAVRDRSAV